MAAPDDICDFLHKHLGDAEMPRGVAHQRLKAFARWCSEAEKLAPPAAETHEKEPSVKQHMERIAQAIGTDTAGQILRISQQTHRPGEDRMRDILDLDHSFVGKNSEQWGTLLASISTSGFCPS